MINQIKKIFLSVLLLPLLVNAQSIIGTLPNTISDGQPIDAVPIMNNYNYIVNQVNANVPTAIAAPQITSGTINGATIGASSPSTGAFTTLTESTTPSLTANTTSVPNTSWVQSNLGSYGINSFVNVSTSATQSTPNSIINVGSTGTTQTINSTGWQSGNTITIIADYSSGGATAVTVSGLITYPDRLQSASVNIYGGEYITLIYQSSGNFIWVNNSAAIRAGGIVGIVNGSNACTGCIGEFLDSGTQSATISPGPYTNITSLSLSPGSWQVWAIGTFNSGSGFTTYNLGFASSSGGTPAFPAIYSMNTTTLYFSTAVLPQIAYNVTSSTTVYCNAAVNGSGAAVNVRMYALRIR